MDPEALIHQIYAGQPELEALLLLHSRQVANLSTEICDRHPELRLDRRFLYEAAMLHDIGIIHTHAPGILCQGTAPYICHGLIGGQMLRHEGLPKHARVAERHTGTGLTVRQIASQNLPLPRRDFSPQTTEEQVICYADKFYSKSKPEAVKSVEQVEKSLSRFGKESLERFRQWHTLFS